jgi:hypothetical protein
MKAHDFDPESTQCSVRDPSPLDNLHAARQAGQSALVECSGIEKTLPHCQQRTLTLSAMPIDGMEWHKMARVTATT